MEIPNEDSKLAIEQIPRTEADTAPEVHQLLNLRLLIEDDAHARWAAKQKGKNFGPVTPFAKLTDEWGGAIPEGVHILMGGPGVGKTAFALQIASHCECPCIYITCEMSPIELARRITARETGTRLRALKDGSLSGREVRDKVDQAALKCPHLTIINGVRMYVTPEWITKTVAASKRDNPHFLIVIDSLHAWAGKQPTKGTDYDTITGAIDSLVAISEDLKVPIIALCERNRASFGKNAPTDKINAGAGSRKIEYGSDSVISLERDDEKNETPSGGKPIILEFAKNRNGSPGAKINYIFQGGYQRYTEQ